MKAARVVAEVEGQPLERSTTHSRLVTSPDSSSVALLSPDLKRLVVWDPAARTTTEVPHGHDELSAVGFSPDGKRVATAGPKTPRPGAFGLSSAKGPQVVTVWDLAARRQLVSAEVGEVRFGWLTFSPDGKQLLAAGSEDVEGFGPAPVGPRKE